MPTNGTPVEDIASRINDLHLEDLRNEAHPSVFDVNPGYDLLIVRLPVLGQKLRVESTGFILTANGSYVYERTSGRFRALEGRFDGPYRIIDPIIDSLLKAFTQCQDKIADMEDLLYVDRAGADFMTKWLGFKRDILRIERVLLRAAATFEELVGHYEPQKDFPVDSYVDLHEHTDRMVRAASLQLSKLDYIYNFFSARTNEKMNRLIYLLTVISAIFLPLNLMVGFFGMNTSGLPYTQGGTGTVNVAVLMSVLLFATSLILYVWHKKRARVSE